jgi:hypothetical protein
MAGKPSGVPMPGYSVLLVSDRLKKFPEEVEQMDEYWFNRWLLFIEAEGIANKREAEKARRQRK